MMMLDLTIICLLACFSRYSQEDSRYLTKEGRSFKLARLPITILQQYLVTMGDAIGS